MRIFKIFVAISLTICATLPAASQEENRNFPLGSIGGQFRITPGSSFARVVSIDPTGPGAAAGLQVDDYIYGAFSRTFTPTGSYHHGVTQELGFAVDRAEGGTGTLPLNVLRPGSGALQINVNVGQVGAFDPVYPRSLSDFERGDI